MGSAGPEVEVEPLEESAASNRAHWDELAEVHGRGTTVYYDLGALVGGASSLSVAERAGLALAVGDVAGRNVLHLQCHLGMDAVSLARLGAHVTGVDFSTAALRRAEDLASRCGVQVDFLEADARSLPEVLHHRFDLVYATIGVLNWIDDLDAWMASARAALSSGGRLLLIDVHPLYAMFQSLDPLDADFPYASTGPVAFQEQGTYADRDAVLSSTSTVEFGHSLGEVVTAAVRSGLRVQYLEEHLESEFDPRGLLSREADGLFRLRLGGRAAPLLYTVIADHSD